MADRGADQPKIFSFNTPPTGGEVSLSVTGSGRPFFHSAPNR